MDSVAQHGGGGRRFALKKHAPQLLLEPPDGNGQRRLGDAAASGCPREIALLAQRQKVSNLVHFHAHPLPHRLRLRTRLPSMSALECEAVHISTLRPPATD